MCDAFIRIEYEGRTRFVIPKSLCIEYIKQTDYTTRRQAFLWYESGDSNSYLLLENENQISKLVEIMDRRTLAEDRIPSERSEA